MIYKIIDFISLGLCKRTRMVRKAYVNRIKNGHYYHNWRDRSFNFDDVKILETDFLPALHGASSSFYIADKDYQNNKINTDNLQGNIGHNKLMFPNGSFYDYRDKQDWASPDEMYVNIYCFLILRNDITIKEICPLVQDFLNSNIKLSVPERYINISRNIVKKARELYPEEFI